MQKRGEVGWWDRGQREIEATVMRKEGKYIYYLIGPASISEYMAGHLHLVIER
jgi:hypothetical protein